MGTVPIRYIGTSDALVAGIRAPIDAAVAQVGAVAVASRVAVAEDLAGWDDAVTAAR